MKKIVLAICDLEALYACNFMEYISRKQGVPFEIQAFTSVEKLKEAAKKEHIEILLISDKAMEEEVKELPVGQIIILSEGVHDPMLDKYPSIYKYQSSDAVIREVMSCYGESVQEARPQGMPLKKPMEIIGIYSPLGRVLKTSFALTLGQILAKDRAVLYLNLEDYSGFEGLFERNYDSNLSDLLYYVTQKQQGLVYRIGQMTETINNLDYIPPVLSPGDIRAATGEEWNFLLDELEFRSSYEALILDFGNSVDDLYGLMGRCEKIYMPVLSDVVSRGKISQFESILRLWDLVEILEKIEKVKPPFHNCVGSGEEYIQQLVWSQLGDYVRKLLRKDVS